MAFRLALNPEQAEESDVSDIPDRDFFHDFPPRLQRPSTPP